MRSKAAAAAEAGARRSKRARRVGRDGGRGQAQSGSDQGQVLGLAKR